jgi:hypothetical protein
MAADWCLKLTFCFVVATRELLHLDKQIFLQWKTVDNGQTFWM